MREVALAPHPVAREFEADVLARLRRADARMHGCVVVGVEAKIDGAVAIWFAGPRDGKPWRGALRLSFPWLHQRGYAADSSAVTEVALQLLDALVRNAAPKPCA